jgi:hypothetical protein
MKWNWGTKLFIGAALFMIMLIAFGVLMMQESISLVERDYYPKGQEFQKQIERRDNGLIYASETKIEWVNGQLQLSLPPEFNIDGLSGTLHMYNRTDDTKDAVYQFSYKSDSLYLFAATNLHGRYLAKINWAVDGKEYYVEKSIILP